jgi:hypothetical protein
VICAASKDAYSATILNTTIPIWRRMSVSALIVLAMAAGTTWILSARLDGQKSGSDVAHDPRPIEAA